MLHKLHYLCYTNTRTDLIHPLLHYSIFKLDCLVDFAYKDWLISCFN